METLQTLARHEGPRGEVVLRRRTHGAETIEELIVNGVFAMDSSDTTSERRLAELAITGLAEGGRILVGGLGLGYTVTQLLGHGRFGRRRDRGVPDRLGVRRPHSDVAGRGGRPDRPACTTLDLRLVLTGLPQGPRGPWNAILLDVDNGPDFLIHDANEALYTDAGLRAAYDQLTEGGICAIWCQGPSPRLLETLRSISPEVGVHLHAKERQDEKPPDVIYTMVKVRGAR